MFDFPEIFTCDVEDMSGATVGFHGLFKTESGAIKRAFRELDKIDCGQAHISCGLCGPSFFIIKPEGEEPRFEGGSLDEAKRMTEAA